MLHVVTIYISAMSYFYNMLNMNFFSKSNRHMALVAVSFSSLIFRLVWELVLFRYRNLISMSGLEGY